MTILKNEFLISIKKNEALKKSAKQVILIDKIKKLSSLWLTYDNESYPNGCFMDLVTNELYSIYCFKSNSEFDFYQRINQSAFYDEIKIFEKICFICDIKILELLKKTNKNDESRIFLKQRFFDITKGSLPWNKLEQTLDLYMVNRKNSDLKHFYLQDINNLLKKSMDYLVINGSIEEKIYLEQLDYIYKTQELNSKKNSKIK